VGESKHIERRFFTHYQNLLGGCHPNKGLRKALRINGIDSFFSSGPVWERLWRFGFSTRKENLFN